MTILILTELVFQELVDELDELGVFDFSRAGQRNRHFVKATLAVRALPLIQRGALVAELFRRHGIATRYFSAVSGSSEPSPLLLTG